MRYLATVVALLLAVLLVPRAGALIEDLVHVLDTGHTLHDSEHHDEPPAEHGCSGPYHSCPCHHTVQFIASGEMVRLSAIPARDTSGLIMVEVMVGREDGQEIERPPAA